MIPLHDNIPPRTFPFVNYSIIAICTVVFLLQGSYDSQGVSLVERFGMIPARVANPRATIKLPEVKAVRTQYGMQTVKTERLAQPSAVPPYLTLLTCVFLHGGLMHCLGNMWFLHIFGDNVEDRLGHGGYLLFYLAAGVAASLTHLLTNQGSPVPTIGASGAIAGVMGAYLFMYPKANVVSILPIFIILQMIVLPAPVFLGIWFLLQIYNGVMMSGASTGVAWWAHIGGFVMGMGVAKLLDVRHLLRPPVEQRRRSDAMQPGSHRIQLRR